jgi:hypothetical protein
LVDSSQELPHRRGAREPCEDGGGAVTIDGVSPPGPERAVFKVSPLVVLAALALALCATPVAFGAPGLWLVYLVPLGIVVWTLRTRTVADADGLRVRRLVGSRRVAWDAVTALRFDDRARVHAVLDGGDELALPAVHARDLHVLALASGGRVPDPTAG